MQVPGDAVQIVAAAAIAQQLQQSRDGAAASVRQHLVSRFRLTAQRGRWSSLEVRLGHELVDVVDVQRKLGGIALARLLHRDGEVGADACRVSSDNDDSVRQEYCFLDVVGDQENTLGRDLFLGPQLHQLAAQVLGSQDIEGGKRFVHEKNLGRHRKGARESDALLHASGEFFRICRFEAFESHGVQGSQRPVMAFRVRYGAGEQRDFDIVEREALEDNRDVGAAFGERLAAP